MDLNPGQLDALVTIADLGSFDAAARHLHITSSAVSQRIRALEAAAGLCSVSQNSNGDQRASTLFGSGTLNGQDGVNARAGSDFARLLHGFARGVGRGTGDDRNAASGDFNGEVYDV